MKHTLIVCFAALLTGGVSYPVDTAASTSLYVATNGDDANPGTKAKPFATLERARDAARGAKAAEAVTIYLRGGRHELARPLEFTAADSGTKERPVVWRAYQNERAIISGGAPVTGWQRHDEKLWVADVPWVRERGQPFYQLFVNGHRRIRARMPNEGSYFYTKRLRLTTAAHPLCLGMTYRESDLGSLKDTTNAVIALLHNWVSSFNYVGKFERERHHLTFARPAGVFFLGPEVRYYVEGVFEALDAPGEWHLDASKGA
ncbi:MAG: hypothetical protein WC429_16570, partial [Verrucomicrobiia bacterium]